MSKNTELGSGIGLSGEWKFPKKSPYESDEIPSFPEEEIDVSDFRTPENEIDVDLSDLAPPKKSKYEVSPLNSQNPNLSELSPEEKNKAIKRKFAEVEGEGLEDLTHAARELPPPLPREVRQQKIAHAIEEERDEIQEARDLAKRASGLTKIPFSPFPLGEVGGPTMSAYVNKKEEQNYQFDKSFSSKSKEEVSKLLESLGIEFDIKIESDGSVPRGGILGRNKRHFEKLSKTNPEFVKRYENLLMEYQRAEKQTQPLFKKQPSRAAAGILAAGLASSAMGSTLQRRAESDRQQQKIEKTIKKETAKEISNFTSEIKSKKEISNKIPLDTSTEYTTLPETKTTFRTFDIKPGDKIDKETSLKFKKMNPGEKQVEKLGPNSTVEYIKNTRGENFVLVKFQGEPARGVSVDADGIAHKASDVKMFGADLVANNRNEKTPAFKIEQPAPSETKTRARKIEKTEKKLASVQTEELADLTDEAELEEENTASGSLLDLDARKPEVKLGERAYNPDKGPIKLRTVGKRDTLYNALVRDFAAREGINIVTNRKAAVEKVESWLNEMEGKKFLATVEGKTESVNNLKEILQRPGQSEITLSLE